MKIDTNTKLLIALYRKCEVINGIDYIKIVHAQSIFNQFLFQAGKGIILISVLSFFVGLLIGILL